MICGTCFGQGWVWRDSLPVTGVMLGDPDKPPEEWLKQLKQPCPECQGQGITSCCDGMLPPG